MPPIARRAAVAGLGSLVVGAPSAAQTDSALPRIGYAGFGSRGESFDDFRDALAALGYRDGQNIRVEARFAGGDVERLKVQLAELVDLQVKVIFVSSTRTALAARAATQTTPIVFTSVFDPLGSGIVTNLARPDGNATGVAIGVGGTGLGSKWLQLLKELAPSLGVVAVLANPQNPASAASGREVEDGAATLGVQILVRQASTKEEIQAALESIERSAAQGLIVTNDPLFTEYRQLLIGFASRRRLPAVYFFSVFAEAGGLMVYGADLKDSIRRAAGYVDRILKGARPADLPVDQPTHFNLVINLKTARELGLVVPPSIAAQADRLIE